jgi:putative ABC transport system permease protein
VKDIAFALSGLGQKKLRSVLLIFCVFIAFLIFTLLSAFQLSLRSDAAGPANRLVATNRISPAQSLPIAYAGRIARLPGVKDVSWAQWFGGYFREPRNAIASYAVDVESFIRVSPDIVLPDDQKQAFIANRDGLLVGRDVAELYGWTINQRIPFTTSIWQRADGEYTWPVVIRGIYDLPAGSAPANVAYLHYDYFDDARAWSNDQIGMVIVKPKSRANNEPVIAAIAREFENSAAQVKAVTEAAYRASFIAQRADIGAIVVAVTGASFFTILLVVGTSMATAVRERTGELAVLKTIGFRPSRLARIIVLETMLIALIGGLAGLAAGTVLAGEARQMDSTFAGMQFSPELAAIAISLMLAFGLITGLLPALQAMRVNVIAALQRS